MFGDKVNNIIYHFLSYTESVVIVFLYLKFSYLEKEYDRWNAYQTVTLWVPTGIKKTVVMKNICSVCWQSKISMYLANFLIWNPQTTQQDFTASTSRKQPFPHLLNK